MRIALVVHKFPPHSLGGTEVYVEGLARALSARHEVSVLYRADRDGDRPGTEWEDRNGFKALRVSRAFNSHRAGPVALFFDTFYNPDLDPAFDRFLDVIQPDILHFHHLMTLSYTWLQRARRRGIPCVLTLHDYWFICANSQLVWPDQRICQGKRGGLNCARCATARVGRGWLQAAAPFIALAFRLRDHAVRGAAMAADTWIAPSEFLIRRYVAEGFPPSRFLHLENGVDVDRIRAFHRKSSDDGLLRITFLGSLAWQKGVHVLVEAARALPADRVRVRIFGPTGRFPDYVADLRRHLDPAHTALEGPVEHDEIGQVLAETDVLVVPSLWYENSPVVIREAFAAGVPVVASRIGALEEKVRDGIDGMLVPPGDVDAWWEALQRLVEEPDLLEQLRRGIPPVLTMDEHVRQVESVYQRVLAYRASKR